MCLVQNNGRVIRQHRAICTITQSKIGKEEVMIYNDDISIDRALAHPGDEARLEVRALLTETSIGARVDMPPERKILRKIRKLGSVARFCFGAPTKDFIKVIDLIEPFQDRPAFSAFDAMQTSVVVAAFHDGGAKLCRQNVLKKRNVLVHQLLLQVLC